jgi:hypothetical protein
MADVHREEREMINAARLAARTVRSDKLSDLLIKLACRVEFLREEVDRWERRAVQDSRGTFSLTARS